MKPSVEQMAAIYSAWSNGFPPFAAAKQLRLVPMTVLTEYVRLDALNESLDSNTPI